MLILAILLLYMLAVKDKFNNFDIYSRDKLGWTIIVLISIS